MAVEGFRRVGSEVAFGESLVELTDVQPIHDLTMTDLMLAARARDIEFNEEADRTQYSFYFRSLDEHEIELPDRFVTIQSWHYSQPDSWRMAINLRSYTMANRYSNKRICYRLEAYGKELVQAKKEVFFVLGNARIDFDDNGNPIETVVTGRKMYEKPMELDDCESVTRMLVNTIKRAAVSHRR
jgi:hypothetical protein